jgi:hypothetical protein
MLTDKRKYLKTEKEVALLQTLEDAGVETQALAVFITGAGEQLIGECLEGYVLKNKSLVGVPYTVKNPKRFIRIQNVSREGMSIQFMIGDLDMIEEGEVEVIANIAYWLEKQGDTTREEMLALYVQFLERKIRNKAVAAGLVLPNERITAR